MTSLFHKKENGYVTLLAVLIVGVIGVSIGVSLVLVGIGVSQTGFALEQSKEARALADACAEKALNALRLDPDYGGNEIFTLGNGNCSILPVISAGRNKRTIQTVGAVGTIVRKVKVEVGQMSPQIGLNSWQEVSDF